VRAGEKYNPKTKINDSPEALGMKKKTAALAGGSLYYWIENPAFRTGHVRNESLMASARKRNSNYLIH